jgi:hypothetical protein
MSKDKKTIKTTKGAITAASKSIIPADYAGWLAGLKDRISSARQRAALSVNQELVRLYHHIGTEILERQTRQGWGAKVIDRLASDLRDAFPEMKGFSSSNLKYMRFFAQICPDLRIGQRAADQLPWFHHRADRTGTFDGAGHEGKEEGRSMSTKGRRLAPVSSFMGLPSVYKQAGFGECARPSESKGIMRYRIK